MNIRTIRWPEEKDAILEHISLVHGEGDKDLLARWYGTLPGFDPADCFVMEGDQGEIIAHTMIIPRQLQIGSSILSTGEIGVVGTLEQYRRRGYATALMERAIQRMAERGDALSMLFGIPNFYERWQYDYAAGLYLTSYESYIETPLALKAGQWDMNHSHQRRTAAQLGVTGKVVTVRPFTLNDLPNVMMLYQRSSEAGHSIVARDEDVWRWQINYMTDIGRHDNASFLVAEYEGALLGYLRMVTSAPVNWFRPDAPRFSIIEFASEDADATEALLGEAAASARDFDAPLIGLYVHPQSKVMQHALAHGAVMRSFTGAGFLRLNDLSLTLDGLHHTLQQRLDQTPFNGYQIRLRISNESASAEMMLGVSNGPEELVTLEATSVDLIRLLTGWFGIEHLPPGSFHERHEGVLRQLFPKGDPKVGIADLL